MSRKYRKKPVVPSVEALQFDYSGRQALIRFLGIDTFTHEDLGIRIHSSDMRDNIDIVVKEGDYIVKDKEGKVHVVSEHDFKQAYEEVSDE